mgnify:CR=1 FL=1
MIMGMTGLTLAWEKAAIILSAPDIISYVLLSISAFLLLHVVLVYLLKVMTASRAVISEFNHPDTSKHSSYISTFVGRADLGLYAAYGYFDAVSDKR